LATKSTEKPKILGDIVEKLHQKWTEKGSEKRTMNNGKLGKKPPKMIEPEIISTERVQHRN
jgi:hypothetical protein